MSRIIHQSVEKTYNFSKYALPIVFLRDIYERKLTLEEADNEQCKLVNELKGYR